MMNTDMTVEVAVAMKSYFTSQDFKDIIAKAVKEAVGQAMDSILKELKAEIAVLEGKVKTLEDYYYFGLALSFLYVQLVKKMIKVK